MKRLIPFKVLSEGTGIGVSNGKDDQKIVGSSAWKIVAERVQAP